MHLGLAIRDHCLEILDNFTLGFVFCDKRMEHALGTWGLVPRAVPPLAASRMASQLLALHPLAPSPAQLPSFCISPPDLANS